MESIDENMDVKIFECPMDSNVISDEKGNCSVCGMKLMEFLISEVKSNLSKSDSNIRSKIDKISHL